VIWAIVALVLAVGEIFTPGLFILGPVALAAVIAGILDLIGVGAIAQVVVFIACAIGSVALIRPIAKSHLREQLTVTTLRNVIGGLQLEETLTSRDEINAQLRGVLDEATGKWGIRVNRVEIRAIDPPVTIKGRWRSR